MNFKRELKKREILNLKVSLAIKSILFSNKIILTPIILEFQMNTVIRNDKKKIEEVKNETSQFIKDKMDVELPEYWDKYRGNNGTEYIEVLKGTQEWREVHEKLNIKM